MASIYRDFEVECDVRWAWEAIADVGAIHERIAKGFVTNTVLEGDTRTVTFASGFVVKEEIVAVDHEHRRLAYRAIGGRAAHHNASFQVIGLGPQRTRVLWITDLLPDEMRPLIEQMVDQGVLAIKETLRQGP